MYLLEACLGVSAFLSLESEEGNKKHKIKYPFSS